MTCRRTTRCLGTPRTAPARRFLVSHSPFRTIRREYSPHRCPATSPLTPVPPRVASHRSDLRRTMPLMFTLNSIRPIVLSSSPLRKMALSAFLTPTTPRCCALCAPRLLPRTPLFIQRVQIQLLLLLVQDIAIHMIQSELVFVLLLPKASVIQHTSVCLVD